MWQEAHDVTSAEQNRLGGALSHEAARAAAAERLRPVLMTSLAMIAGVIPVALAFGQGAEEAAAPLGRAVVGGLVLFCAPELPAVGELTSRE